MNIIETNLAFRGSMSNRARTNRIILHHAEATSCTAEQIHSWHLNNGWSGAGYHFLVRKDGSVYRLRPENKVGAHASGSNSDSLGVCFEGRYSLETMPQAQIDAGRELVDYLKGKYGISLVQRHKDVCSTDCPGSNFPFDAIVNGAVVAPQPVETPAAQPSGEWFYPRDTDWVCRLQAECNRQGFSNQVIDGLVGPNTLNGCPTLRQGAQGEITRLLQEFLIHWGYPCGSAGADGIFGQGTLDAVRTWQRDKGLAADGVVGRNTWRTILGF